jgi:hypothetical protein
MKPEAQRIAIAEACGWTPIGRPEQYDPPIGFPAGALTVAGNQQLLPDYLNDLNAMHEAEKSADVGNFVIEYTRILHSVLEKEGSHPKNHPFYWMATAAQRAEAFLRTLNLWTD